TLPLLCCRAVVTGRNHADFIQWLNSWRDEEDEFGGAFHSIRILEKSSDDWNASQARNLTDIERIRVDENSADDRRTAIRYEYLCSRRLVRNRGDAVYCARKIRLTIRYVDLQQNRAGLGDLRSHRQLQREALERHSNRIVDVRLNGN